MKGLGRQQSRNMTLDLARYGRGEETFERVAMPTHRMHHTPQLPMEGRCRTWTAKQLVRQKEMLDKRSCKPGWEACTPPRKCTQGIPQLHDSPWRQPQRKSTQEIHHSKKIS